MDALVTLFFAEKKANGSRLSCQLSQHQDDVIELFGGFSNMVELCVTHPNVLQHLQVHSKQFDTLNKIILETGQKSLPNDDAKQIDINDHTCDTTIQFKNVNSDNKNQQAGATADAELISDNDDSTKVNKHTVISKPNNCNNQTQTVTTCTTADFHNSRLVIDCDPRDNVLFTLIEKQNVALSIYNGILSGYVIASLVAGGCIVQVLKVLYSDGINFLQPVFFAASILLSIMGILYCIALISITNKTVMKLVVNTFDFWFKLYSTVLLIGSGLIRSYATRKEVEMSYWDRNDALAAQLLWQGVIIIISIVLFLLDATPVSIKCQRFVTIGFVVYCCFEVTVVYFYGIDYQWNPFDWEYTQISFKGISLSSLTNLMLFVAKPLVSDMMRYLRNNMCGRSSKDDFNCNSDNPITSTKQSEYTFKRCRAVYKRPSLKWYILKEPSLSSNNVAQNQNDEHKLNTILSSAQSP